MTNASLIVPVGPLRPRVGAVCGYLYLLGEEDLTHAQGAALLSSMGVLVDELTAMGDDPDEDAIQVLFYDAAKRAYGDEKSSIREFFRHMYLIVAGSPNGPRWGQYVKLLTVDHFVYILRTRFEDPFGV